MLGPITAPSANGFVGFAVGPAVACMPSVPFTAKTTSKATVKTV
jgi:hypothetical protein